MGHFLYCGIVRYIIDDNNAVNYNKERQLIIVNKLPKYY